MSKFKLLAIRPLEGCDNVFLKNLIPGMLYKFYRDYSFVFEKAENEGEVASINYEPTIPGNFFNISSDVNPDISVCALVGKNGSGKSSLTELFYAAVFLLSVQEKTLEYKDDDEVEEIIDDIENEIKVAEKDIEKLFDDQGRVPDEYFSKNPYEHSHKVIIDQVYSKMMLELNIKNAKEKLAKLTPLLESRKKIRRQLNVEIFYQVSKTFFKLKVTSSAGQKNCIIEKVPSEYSKLEEDENLIRISNRETEKKDTESLSLSDMFFYTIALNYSHYGLNSKEIGPWINELFHKNDGYQTPIVLNPMRDDGNFDINTENYLVRSRLLANIFSGNEQSKEIARDKSVKAVRIELDASKFETEKDKLIFTNLQNYRDKFWPLIERRYFENSRKRKPTEWDEPAREYIFRKLIQIAEKYPTYDKYKNFNLLTVEVLEQYLIELDKDSSHIAFKFRQAINFLRYNYAYSYFDARNKSDISIIDKVFSDENLSIEKIYLVPPSFLKIDLFFSITDDNNSFNKLSSGEKQKIFSISSIAYHLKYLDSVKVKDTLPNKYKSINLIFDEIELYYHPDLQRTFIFDLISSIKGLGLTSIENVNCLFLTHSPFILSDIPNSNVLYLELADNLKTISKENTSESFASNIHDLLANNFFLDNGFVGEFAKEKINSLIEFLTYPVDRSELFDKVSAKSLIDCIGEPYLKNDLLELFHQKFFNEADEIDKEIESLNKRKLKLFQKL